MAQITVTEVPRKGGYNVTDDIFMATAVFPLTNDYTNIDTSGYDYVEFMPFGTDSDTNPTSGTVTFEVYGPTAILSGVFVFSDHALLPEDAGYHSRATVTSTARIGGYLAYPPKHLMIRAVIGVDGADLSLLIQMRKRNARGQFVGRG